jgi:hypothetical protein
VKSPFQVGIKPQQQHQDKNKEEVITTKEEVINNDPKDKEEEVIYYRMDRSRQHGRATKPMHRLRLIATT